MDKHKNEPGYIRAIILDGIPKIGKEYNLHNPLSGRQRRLFEPLVRLYYKSLCFPDDWPVETWEDLRDIIKRKLGQGVEQYEYVTDEKGIKRVKSLAEIPSNVIKDYNSGNHNRIRVYKLISTTKYTVKQMYSMTDMLLRQMIITGVGKSRYKNQFNKILDKIGFTE